MRSEMSRGPEEGLGLVRQRCDAPSLLKSHAHHFSHRHVPRQRGFFFEQLPDLGLQVLGQHHTFGLRLDLRQNARAALSGFLLLPDSSGLRFEHFSRRHYFRSVPDQLGLQPRLAP
jgi:hypothetical protein